MSKNFFQSQATRYWSHTILLVTRYLLLETKFVKFLDLNQNVVLHTKLPKFKNEEKNGLTDTP